MAALVRAAPHLRELGWDVSVQVRVVPRLNLSLLSFSTAFLCIRCVVSTGQYLLKASDRRTNETWCQCLSCKGPLRQHVLMGLVICMHCIRRQRSGAPRQGLVL